MHELGVVFSVVDAVRDTAREAGATHVDSVTLEIGEVTGIVNDYLIDCWNWAANKEDLLRGAKMNIETIEAITYCEGCGGYYKTVPNGKKCPLCGSDNTYLYKGKEFIIKDITVDDTAENAGE